MFFVFLWKNACGCFALLPRCSRNAGSGKNPVCPWQEQWNKILHTIHLLLDIAYEHAEAGLYDVFIVIILLLFLLPTITYGIGI